ncbi:MAG: hypothetical protein BGO67_07720 [Alphaproteobacteria bacterium 41-28]|nr:MAG: hypothetical protein BGO67_07720 [Alphaproteobacteria bacterium 41-28]
MRRIFSAFFLNDFLIATIDHHIQPLKNTKRDHGYNISRFAMSWRLWGNFNMTDLINEENSIHYRHCEDVKRPKQSRDCITISLRLLRLLQRLAMTILGNMSEG